MNSKLEKTISDEEVLEESIDRTDMPNDIKLESLINAAVSGGANLQKRRRNVRKLFDYLSSEIPAYFGLKKPRVYLRFGRYQDFKRRVGWKKIAATAFYNGKKTIYLNERTLKPPYRGVTYSKAMVVNPGRALALALAHELGHALDYNYNQQQFDGTIFAYINDVKTPYLYARSLQESTAEAVATAYLKSALCDFSYTSLSERSFNDNGTAFIYGCSICAGKLVSSIDERSRVKIIREVILSRNPDKKLERLFSGEFNKVSARMVKVSNGYLNTKK